MEGMIQLPPPPTLIQTNAHTYTQLYHSKRVSTAPTHKCTHTKYRHKWMLFAKPRQGFLHFVICTFAHTCNMDFTPSLLP